MNEDEIIDYGLREQAVREGLDHFGATELTPEGEAAVEMIEQMFKDGANIENIAEIFEIEVEAIKVLLMTKSILEERKREV